MKRSEAIEAARILKALIELNNVSKILDTFIPAFENSVPREGHHYLHGNFNVTGTKSGRLSSSKINLQNLPSTGSKYAKAIKKCFTAPKNWLFVGCDFNALEARIGALLTKDPEKMKIYTDGYDSHSLMAYTYWKEQMPDIDDSLESINSISTAYPQLRQKSKTVTFALQYGGTAHTLHKNSGFSMEEGEQIVERYNNLYSVSKEWEQNLLKNASKNGYVNLAFGLKLRTPLLEKCILGKRNTPKSAEAEARTVVNAAQQSYGLLNSRANTAFMQLVYASKFKNDIRPVAQIHDSGYYIIKANAEVLKFVNDNLIKEMQWQNLAPIKYESIGLGGTLEVYYPNWSTPVEVPNNATLETIENILNDFTGISTK